MTTNRRNMTSEDLKQEVLNKITEYVEGGFAEAKQLHELIMEANPTLCPRLWYGMPGYAKTKDSAVLCFFRKDELISFGITEAANTEAFGETNMVPSAWYINQVNDEVARKINDVIVRATQ